MTNDIDEPVLAAIDPEIGATLLSRRQALTKGAAASAGLAGAMRLASVPLALAALSRSAYAQSGIPQVVIDVLNFALTLEYLEAEFYQRGLAASGLIPAGDDRTIFTNISMHEDAHVAYLKDVLGAAAVREPTFDFTARGMYPTVFTSYATFKAVAQAFEDTGVRAYKGQAPALQPYDAYLTAALTIHSVEARHASEVRRLRGNFTDTEPFYEGWITGNQTDVPGASKTYAGEDNVVHLGIDATTVLSMPIARNQVTESFDEPLSKAAVLAIVAPFIVSTS